MSSPKNATTTEWGRTYEWPPTGEVFDSVTTLIKYGTPTGYGLIEWFKKVNVEWAVQNRDLWLPIAERSPQAAIDLIMGEADRQRDEASARGNEVHDWAEKIVLGTASIDDVPASMRGYVGQFVKFLADWKPDYEATEATVYSRRYGYAGTLDWIARIDGHGLVLGDIKTKPDGKAIYGESIGLQLAAYRFADFIGLPDGTEAPVPKVDACLALVIHPSSYELIPVRADEVAFAAFLHVQQVRWWCDTECKSVLGKRLRPPRRATEPPRPFMPTNVAALVD